MKNKSFLEEILVEAFLFVKKTFQNTHKEGYFHILTFLAVTVVSFLIWVPLGVVLLLLTIWCVTFFRDPERVVPAGANLVVSPADGIVSDIISCLPPKEILETDEEMIRVSIFLSVFNVHVNRVPVGGVVQKTVYHAGKFFNASLDKASEFNERNSILIENEGDKKSIVLVQIAGLLARRIVSYAKPSDKFTIGARYGIIKFGSRVDIYLPKSYVLKVQKGQTMLGGETIIATF